MSGYAKRKFNDECLVEVNHVSKKFCRNLQMSLQYGIRDLMREAVGLGASRKLRRGEFYAVKDANFAVRRGESVALLGPNGTGKSTMLKLINGLLKPNQGSIRIRGKVGALTALGAGFDPILTGRENIYINGAVLGMNKSQVDSRFDEIVDFSELGDKVETPVKNYSSGERSRLGYSVAAFLQTDLLLMDEILATGDLRFKAKCFNHLEQLLEQGTAIILVSHAVGRLQRICKRAIVFNEGETAFDGDIKEGISLYERMLNLEQFSKGLTKESDNVKTATAWVETVELIDSSGTVIEKAQHGDDVRIRIDMLASKLIIAPRVFISIESTSGVIGATVSPPRAFNLDEEGYKVELNFPSLPLLQGTYLVNVKLTDHTSKEIFHFRKGVMLLRVESDLKSGFVALDHHWDY